MEIWRALAGFEELLEAMDHRFAELWEAEMHEANGANERRNFKGDWIGKIYDEL